MMLDSATIATPESESRLEPGLAIGDPIKVTVATFDPTRESAPVYKTFSVPYAREMRILEALDYIVEELGESLAYQWFCGVKKCGMCGMLVNGRQTLACWEPVQPEMVIQPLPNFPVVRDLVIDRQSYFENTKALKPLIQRTAPYPGFPEPLKPADMIGPVKMAHCIECMLCVSACPTVSPDFMGPAPMVQLAKLALDPRDGGDRARAALDPGGIEHCVSCRQCSRVCPAHIPVYEMAIEGLRAQIREQNLEPPKTARDRFFANVHAIGRIGAATAPVSNWIVSSRAAGWFSDKVLRIDHRRPPPKFAQTSFERWFKRRRRTNGGPHKVVLFHDTFINYYEPEIGQAATEVLERLGYDITLAENRKCCGRPMLSQGFPERAKAHASRNVEILHPHAAGGTPIICLEPSCVVMMRDEYPKLLSSPEAKTVAKNVLTFEEFIATHLDEKQLRTAFSGAKRDLLVHGHCQQKTVIGMGPSMKALGYVGTVEEIPTTCCGMAGANGYECEHYTRSMQAGEVALFPTIRKASPEIEIVAAGTSCRQQILHGTGRRARHPAQILQEALATSSNE